VGRSGLDVANQVQLLGFEQRSSSRNGALNHIGDRNARHVPGEFAGFDLGQIEHVVDQLGEPFAFADHDIEIVDDLALGLLHLAVFLGNEREEPLFKPAANDLGEAQHRGERRAQLMADGGKERALGRIGFFRGRSAWLASSKSRALWKATPTAEAMVDSSR
jgi:hypothetical protein